MFPRRARSVGVKSAATGDSGTADFVGGVQHIAGQKPQQGELEEGRAARRAEAGFRGRRGGDGSHGERETTTGAGGDMMIMAMLPLFSTRDRCSSHHHL
jgi:hypothetical protein